jgi:hypothetical protein
MPRRFVDLASFLENDVISDPAHLARLVPGGR